MSDAAVTIDRLKAFQVALHFPTQIAFNLDLVVGDGVNDFVQLLRSKIFRPQIGVDIRLLEDALGRTQADPVNVGERRFDAFVRRNFNSE